MRSLDTFHTWELSHKNPHDNIPLLSILKKKHPLKRLEETFSWMRYMEWKNFLYIPFILLSFLLIIKESSGQDILNGVNLSVYTPHFDRVEKEDKAFTGVEVGYTRMRLWGKFNTHINVNWWYVRYDPYDDAHYLSIAWWWNVYPFTEDAWDYWPHIYWGMNIGLEAWKWYDWWQKKSDYKYLSPFWDIHLWTDYNHNDAFRFSIEGYRKNYFSDSIDGRPWGKGNDNTRWIRFKAFIEQQY